MGLKNVREGVIFAHSVSGCDTTFAFFAKWNGKTISLLNNKKYLEHLTIFNNQPSTKEEIAVSGERIILALYKACLLYTSRCV